MKNTKIDARELSPELQENKRIQAVQMRKDGFKNKDISLIVGLSTQTISSLYTKYNAKGMSALTAKKRGVTKGTNTKLSKEMEEKIITKLINTTPMQFNFEFSLWTRESVQHLIKCDTGIQLPISTVGEYLRRWQFSSKKHRIQCYINEENKGTEIKKWFDEKYIEIKKQAKIEKADIWWVSEKKSIPFLINFKGCFLMDTQTKNSSAEQKIGMLSAITNTGKSMFALYDESADMEKFIDFMEKVTASCNKKVYLIIDKARGCHAVSTKNWVRKNKEKIAIFYLPSFFSKQSLLQ